MSRRRASDRVPPPADLRPMLATLVHEVPAGDGWAYEMKWDGVRAFMLVDGSSADRRVRVTNRKGGDISAGYPEFAGLGDELGATPKRCSTARSSRSTSTAGRASSCCNVACTCATRRRCERSRARGARRVHGVRPLVARRRAPDGPSVYGAAARARGARIAAARDGRSRRSSTEHGDAALETSRELGLEGIVAKRLDSRYESGRRSSSWRKIKHDLRQEFVIGGWSPGEGWRSGGIGALLLGYYDDDGTLHYAGKVGTGFSREASSSASTACSARSNGTESPFAGAGVPRAAHFVEPRYVAEVRFAEWTTGGTDPSARVPGPARRQGRPRGRAGRLTSRPGHAVHCVRARVRGSDGWTPN